MNKKLKSLTSFFLVFVMMFTVFSSVGLLGAMECEALVVEVDKISTPLYKKDGIVYYILPKLTGQENRYQADVHGIEQEYDEKGNPIYTDIVIPDKVIMKGSDYTASIPVVSVNKDAFKGNKEIKSVTFGKNIDIISYSAFQGCTNLKKVVFNNGLKNIESKAFYRCKALKNIDFPESLQQIHHSAFKGCKNLTELYFPASVSSIYGDAFKNCEKVKKIQFENVKNIQTINIKPDAFKNTLIVNKAHKKGEPTIIHKNVILEAKAVKAKTLKISGDKIKTIASGAYRNNKNIGKVVIDGVKHIGISAFEGSSVTEVTLKSVKTIGNNVFYKCKSLTNCDINGVKNIPKHTFEKCHNLKTITLGKAIEKIDDAAIFNCKKLENIIIKSKKKITWGNNKSSSLSIFYKCKELETIKMNSSKVSNTIKKVKFPKGVVLDVPNNARSAYSKKVKCEVI